MKRGGRRLVAKPAGEIRPGDVLWSSATLRELRVVAAHVELVPSSGNLLADAEDPREPRAEGIVLTVMDERTRTTQRLGAYAPRARLQVVRHVGLSTPVDSRSSSSPAR